jgi:beta-glucosidase
VDEGVAVVMSAYNRVNGEWCGENRALLTDVLRHECGFEGFVISDWIFGLRDAARSLRAGLDVEMPYRMIRAGHLGAALEHGDATWAEVDLAVERIVATRHRFEPVLARPAPGRDVLAGPEHRALAREAAAASVVVLRNEPVDGIPLLPLDPMPASSVALLGRLGTAVNLGDGGSSDVWAPEVVTVADGLRAALPDVDVIDNDGSDLASAAAVAASAELAVVVVGYTRLDEGEYIGEFASSQLTDLFPGQDDPDLVDRFTDQIATERLIEPPDHATPEEGGVGFAVGGDRRSLHLHEDDVSLIRTVAAANPRTVVAVVAGSAVVVSEWDHLVPALVQAWYSGMEGGHGLADVLTGRVDATGRLPFSVPVFADDLPAFEPDASEFTYDGWHGYWYLARGRTEPAYPFGFGLSYTTFSIRGAEVEIDAGSIRISVSVTNTGRRPGSELVQLYMRRRGSEHPERLRGFGRVALGPGASGTVDLVIDLAALAERDTAAHTMVIHSGPYDVRVARHFGDPGIALAIEVDDPPG